MSSHFPLSKLSSALFFHSSTFSSSLFQRIMEYMRHLPPKTRSTHYRCLRAFKHFLERRDEPANKPSAVEREGEGREGREESCCRCKSMVCVAVCSVCVQGVRREKEGSMPPPSPPCPDRGSVAYRQAPERQGRRRRQQQQAWRQETLLEEESFFFLLGYMRGRGESHEMKERAGACMRWTEAGGGIGMARPLPHCPCFSCE